MEQALRIYLSVKNTKIIEFRTIETDEIIENIAKSNGLNQSIKINPESLSDKQWFNKCSY